MPRRASRRTRRNGWRSSGASDPVRTDLFINNEWRPAASGKRFPVENPATEEVLAQVAAGDAADVDAAVKAARGGFGNDAWRGPSHPKRGALPAQAADLLRQRSDAIAL